MMSLTTGYTLNNRYQIEKQIGRGGYGAVYRAYDTTLKQPCAIKENLNTSPEAQRQFEREALMLARLRHASLPRVIDHFVLPEQGQYLVMDFIEGRSLHQILLEQAMQPLSESEALAWIEQVCEALDYLHRQSPPIIHRDVKPHNIIITPTGRAMLVDFGLSKIYEPSRQTSTGAQGVTPGYAPPEQYGYAGTTTRSDIYALGATLYVLLTGRRPPDAIRRVTESLPVTPLRQMNPAISLHVEEAILRALDTTPLNRFQSVDGFYQALTKPLPPTKPVKVTASSRMSGWFSTRWGKILLGGLLILILFLVALGVWLLIFTNGWI